MAAKTSDEYFKESELPETVKPIWQAGWLAAMDSLEEKFNCSASTPNQQTKSRISPAAKSN